MQAPAPRGPGRSGRLALVTSARAHGTDTDEELLLAALAAAGLAADVLDWDAPADWADYSLAVLRSTWDYAARHAEFLAWAERAATRTTLLNSAETVRWNTDKRYLDELRQAGIPVIDTEFVVPGSTWRPTGLDGSIVVKPAVSAGAQDTSRYRPDQLEPARAHVSRLLAAQRVAMVQPYLDGVERTDESALIYLDGRYSHAAGKGALLRAGAADAGLFAEERLRPHTTSAAERAVGDAVLDWLADSSYGTPLYARVDLLPAADGAPVLLELELTEPSLFLDQADGAAERFAAVIAGRLCRQRHGPTI